MSLVPNSLLVLGSGGYYNNGEVLKCKVAWEGGGKIIVLCSDTSMVVECLTNITLGG